MVAENREFRTQRFISAIHGAMTVLMNQECLNIVKKQTIAHRYPQNAPEPLFWDIEIWVGGAWVGGPGPPQPNAKKENVISAVIRTCDGPRVFLVFPPINKDNL